MRGGVGVVNVSFLLHHLEKVIFAACFLTHHFCRSNSAAQKMYILFPGRTFKSLYTKKILCLSIKFIELLIPDEEDEKMTKKRGKKRVGRDDERRRRER